MGRISRRLLGISTLEVTFERRGFRIPAPGVQEHLEEVGRSFLAGYTAALDVGRPQPLAHRLDEVGTNYRGFAFEGAAMALAMTDFLTPWRRPRLSAFLAGPGAPHTYLVHVGAGWALARLPMRVGPLLERLDPVNRWLALDGWGFHQGYFHHPKSVRRGHVPWRLHGYALHAFDQGLGRSLWFVEGADPEAIAAAVAALPERRRSDLWSGVGLACAYAGGVDRGVVTRLWELAKDYRVELAQGAAFAAEARRLGGNPIADTDLACRALCGMSAAEASALTEELGRNLPLDGSEPAYEIWRRRVQDRLFSLMPSQEVEPCTRETLSSGATG